MWQQFVHLDGVTMPHMYLKAYEKLIGIERPPKTNDRHIWKELVSLGFKGCPKWACIDFMWQAYEVFFFFNLALMAILLPQILTSLTKKVAKSKRQVEATIENRRHF